MLVLFTCVQVFLPIGSFTDLAFNPNDELVLVDVIAIEDAVIPPEELDFVMIGAVAGILLLLLVGLGVIYARSRRRAPVTQAMSIHDGSDGFSAYGRAYSDM